MAQVLVADDDPLLRETLCSVLRRAGHSPITASNGREAVERLRSVPIDLLVLDMFMPEQEGIETILELRRERVPISIIAVSGGGSSASGVDILSAAAKLGADHTIAKPFTPRRFLELVERVLAQGTHPIEEPGT